MENTARLLTPERSDLMNLNKRLFGSIDDSFLLDPEKPLIVSVNGSWKSGKKIIPDMARVVLLGSRCKNQNGSYNHDEYWVGHRNGHPVEIDFINIQGWPFARDLQSANYETPEDQWSNNILHAFLNQRKHGGISFVHNHNDFDTSPDIDIYLETPLIKNVLQGDPGRLHTYPELLTVFSQMSAGRTCDDEYDEVGPRFVEITVNNQTLLQSAGFQEMFKSLISSGRQTPVYRAAPAAFAPARKMA